METIRKLLAPPTYATEDDTSKARLINFISLIYLLIVLVALIGGALIANPQVTGTTTAEFLRFLAIRIVPLLVIPTVTQLLLRNGRLRASSYVVVYGLWAVFMLFFFLNGGLDTPAYSNMILVVLSAGLLFSYRSAFGITAVTVVLAAIGIYLQNTNQLPQPVAPSNIWVEWMGTSLILLASSYLLYLYVQERNKALDRLRDFGAILEERVKARTQAMITSAEVSRSISTITNLDDLFTKVVNEITTNFGYYHAHIYLLDDAKEFLIMVGGTGEVAQLMLRAHHQLALGRGLVGRAAAENELIWIPDVTRDPDWLPNPLLPDTKCETAVPIVIGNELLGVLDVQDNTIGGINREGADLLASIANQIAIAIQNARQLQKTKDLLEITDQLYAVSNTLVQAQTAEDVLLAVVFNTSLIHLDRANILIFNRPWVGDDRPEELTVAAVWERYDQNAGGPVGTVYKQTQLPTMTLIHGHSPTIFRDVHTEPSLGEDVRQILLQIGMRSMVVFPLVVNEQWFGLITGQSGEVLVVEDEEIRQINTLVDQAATIILNQQLVDRTEQALQSTEQQAVRLQQLNSLSNALSSVRTLDEIYVVAGEYMGNLIESTQISLALLDETETRISFVSLHGQPLPDALQNQMSVAGTAVGYCLSHNKIARYPQDGPFTDFEDANHFNQQGLQSLIMAPLVSSGQKLGALTVGSQDEDAYQDTEISFFLQAASMIAAIIESVQLIERTRQLASIVENHPDFIAISNLQGQTQYINPSGLALIGLPGHYDVTTLHTHDLFAEQDAQLLLEEGIPAAIETGGWTAEAMVRHSDGSLIPVEETIGINYDVESNPVGVSVTMHNIASRKAAGERIRQSEQTAREFQEKLTILHELTSFLSTYDDLEHVYRDTIILGRARFNFDRMGLWLFNEDVTLMHGTYGTDEKGQIRDEREFMMLLEHVDWIQPVIASHERRQVSPDTDLYYDAEVVGRGWNVVAILQYEKRPIGWLAVDNLFSGRPLAPYEPELISLYANSLTNIIVNKRAAQTLIKQAAQLQTVTDISRVATSILDTNELLEEVVNMTKERFNLYHVQIYLLQQDNETLTLQAGAGKIGQQLAQTHPTVSLRREQSLVARAARRRQALLTQDVTTNLAYVPNPLLPHVRTQLSVPIVVGVTLLGVLDLLSDQEEFFSRADINIHETLAAQIAAAVQNARQYQQTQETLDELTRLQQAMVHEGWQQYLTARENPLLGYFFDQNEVQPIMKRGENGQADNASALPHMDDAVYTPLTIRGETIGAIGVRDPQGNPVSPEKQQLLTSISQQVAEALERARLFEETELARNLTEQALSETQRRQEELEAVNEIAVAVSTQRDTRQLLETVLTQVQRILNLDNFTVNLYDAESESMIFLLVYDRQIGFTEDLPPVLLQPHHYSYRVVTSRMPQMYLLTPEEAEVAARTRDKALHDDSIVTTSILIAPMMRGAEVMGLVSAQSYQLNAYQQRDLALLTGIAGYLSTALQNVQLFEEIQRRAVELQESAQFLNSVVENLPTLLSVKDVQSWEYVQWNRAIAELYGRTREEVLGHTDTVFMSEQEANFLHLKESEVLASGEVVEIPNEFVQTTDGRTRVLQTRKVPILDTEGNPRFLMSVSEDITDQRQAEETLAKRAVELQTVAEISTSVAATLDAEKLLQDVVDLAWANFELYHVHLYLLNDAGDMLVLAAGAGTVGAKMVAAGHRIALNNEKSLVARSARTRQGLILNNVHDVEGYLPNPLLPDTQSELAVPLIAGNQVIGVFDIQSEELEHFTPQDINIQTTLASQVATALQNARLFTQTQQRAAELATINAINEVASTQLNLDTLIQEVGDRLKDTFDAQAAYIALYDPVTNRVEFPFFVEGDESQITLPRTVDENGGFTAQIVLTRQPILMLLESPQEVYEQGGVVGGVGDRMTDSYMGAPMIVGDRVIGVIGVSSFRELRTYNEADRNLLMTLAGTIGVAVQNAQQFADTRRRAERERIVNEITQKIQGTLNMEAALKTAVQELGDALGAKRTAVKLTLTHEERAENGHGR
jgi:PAS domain S-box-containing protein